MKNILIITEKKYISDIISKALKTQDDNIIVTEIGGHIYTKDETCLQLTQVDLASVKTVTLTDGTTGYILGESFIDTNAEQIKKLLSENSFDVIINACDADKNGDALFEYANSLVGFDSDKIARLMLRNLEEKYIKEQYLSIIL